MKNKGKRLLAALLTFLLCASTALPSDTTVRASAPPEGEHLTEGDTGGTEQVIDVDVKEPTEPTETPAAEPTQTPTAEPETDSGSGDTGEQPPQELPSEKPGGDKQEDDLFSDGSVPEQTEQTQEETPTDFENTNRAADILTVENIRNAGVTCPNFAQAIYDSITSASANGAKVFYGQDISGTWITKTIDDYTNITILLNEFSGTIDASGKEINTIEGVQLLKQTKKLDLTNNNISDMTPLATPDNTTYWGNPKPSATLRSYNTNVDLTGNPLSRFSSQMGGRLKLPNTMADENCYQVTNKFAYIIKDNEEINPVKIPIELITDDKPTNVQDTVIWLKDSYETPTATIPANIGGQVTEVLLSNIKETENIELYMAMTDNYYFHQVTENMPISTNPNPQGQALKFIFPIQIEIYTKLEKRDISTTHRVTLSKKSTDGGAFTPGAEYALYKYKSGDSGETEEIEKSMKVADSGIDVGTLSYDITTGTGTYYFVETKAPAGYALDDTPIPFIVEDGTVDITGGAGNTIDTTEADADGNVTTTTQTLDNGIFLLGGATGEPASLNIIEPAGGSLDTLTLTWTAGSNGGTAGSLQIKVGEGSDTDTVKYVASKDDAVAAAFTKIQECKELYQNMTLSAEFTQKVSVEQTDALEPANVEIKGTKKLVKTNGTAITKNLPAFDFTLENDTAYSDEPKLGADAEGNIVIGGSGTGSVEVKNDSWGNFTFSFGVGSEIAEVIPAEGKDYHYILKEKQGTDTEAYTYDTNQWKVTVNVKKNAEGKLETQKVTYEALDSLGNTITDSTGNAVTNQTGAEFTNTYLLVPLEFTKTDTAGNPLAGAGFTLYECTNTDPAHDHTSGCTWDTDNPFKPQVTSDNNGSIRFDGLKKDITYILVETTAPPGYQDPTAGSYITASADVNEAVTMTGFGSFAEAGMVQKDAAGAYKVKNIGYKNLTIEKTVKGEFSDPKKAFPFTITLTDAGGNGISGDYTYTGASTTGTNAPQGGTLIFTDGAATVSLAHGQSITIADIPAGTKYVIEETKVPEEKYQTWVGDVETNQAEGTLTADTTVSFTNKKEDMQRPTGIFGSVQSGMPVLMAAGALAIGIALLLSRRKKRS